MFINKRPDAEAVIKGGKNYPAVCGRVQFYQANGYVTVRVSVSHLPENASGFYGFHIHEGDSCEGNSFSETKGHYNPDGRDHPLHSGDMPPLISCGGQASMEFRTNRFYVKSIIGKTIIIHGSSDDFRSQPSGNAGEKIACGVIFKN